MRGSGPGGQHRNKRFTGVRVVHLPTGITAIATERRSQAQNLDAALERLEAKLVARAHRPKPRRPTRASRSSREKRLQSKTLRSRTKALRQKGGGPD